MQSSGTGQVRITVDPAPDTEPSWGVGGDDGRIVFTSRRSGTNQIYTVNPDGSGLFGPLTNAGANYQPKWNTLGNRITFVSDRDGNPEIYTMRQGGEEQFRLTNNTFSDFWPSYAPNNSKIVFVSDMDPALSNTELYTVNIDGSTRERITIQQGKDEHPSWGLQTGR
jgi:Tol biopolymer transport system component